MAKFSSEVGYSTPTNRKVAKRLGVAPRSQELSRFAGRAESGESFVFKLQNGSAIAEAWEYNPAWVLMAYFGYLRRDAQQDGYDFWLNVLNNREPGNYRGMVCSFITSAEYQFRFGTVATRTNAECSQ